MVARVKRRDTVVILSGRDKGKQGAVVEVVPKRGKVLVQGCAMVTKHVKPRRQGEVGGTKKQESYLWLSQVMPICSACKQACRINAKQLENDTWVRVCNRCKEVV